MWLRLIKRLVLVGALLLVSLGATTWWAINQSQHVPEFYERAITAPPPENVAASSEQLEAEMQQLQTDATTVGQWQASFAAEQINAWLMEQLPKRFPQLKTRGLQEPRIVIEDGILKAAARFQDNRFDAVLSCEISVQLTDQPNRLAVTVGKIRAGALPLPLSQFQDKLQRLTAPTDLNLQWESRDGETVALIDVPDQYPGQVDQAIVIESIELADQQLTVAGSTGDTDSFAFQPQGAVYRIAAVEEKSDPDFQFPILNVHNELSAGSAESD
ncbi:hypothetical protein NHH03_07445 [Stieleria sp. TO1_6]|uniref:hypothetical protein n=1 Tax=Stieleria tagensis TaxID=2956795 RepID=UPI00209AAC81|nr:hypothetical protein [Stieleria tagensis]MCO8121565.1 hypothetical protein [Stieleria tagensis]